MAHIDGGLVLAKTLQGFGIDTIFTLHGGHLDSVLRAADSLGIRLIDTRHEQAAGLAAMGLAHATGKVGIALITAGGGVTNVVSAAANALADGVPLVILGGAPPLNDVDALPANSGIDQLAVMAGVTKHSLRITHISLLAELVGRAFRIAKEGRPGPVYLDLPSDVLFDQIEEADVVFPNGAMRVAPAAPSRPAVLEALSLLRGASRPVILAGGGVVRSGASNLLVEFVERTGIPVLTNNKSRGVIPTTSPLWGRGFSALGAAKARGHGEADVVVLLGARVGIYTGGRHNSVIPTSARVIQVDVEPEEMGRLHDVHLGITSDCREMLSALLDADDATWPDYSNWAASLTSPSERKRNAGSEADGVLTPGLVGAALASFLPADTVLVADGGETPSWLDAAATSDTAGQWFGHGYLGIMGEGMPLAIGAQIAYPDKRVVVWVGDGAVGFNFAEFDTMVRHNLPIVVVVNNDRQWTMSAHGQELLWGSTPRLAVDLRDTRYDIAASGFGAHAEYVEKLDELAPALERALASGMPACVNVATTAIEIAPVTRRFMRDAAQADSSVASSSAALTDSPSTSR
ncbi:thiamine pyrophosphate-binding protein [Rhodococcus sp. NPDC057014]|uniref:thiamine pyrophosphate-binding protein n=1 Tax=Rhodococcus sp. NPDC057014 TaxID=3346000 RepID=UPI0036304A6B